MRMTVAATLFFLSLLILQSTIIPAFIADPFKPNLLLVMVVYLGLRATRLGYALAAYGIGLVHDTFSGIYLGLNAFAYLATFMLLHHLAERLYADRTSVLIFCVAVATAGVAMVHVIFLSLFLTAPGIYASVFINLVPQMVVNALMASLVQFLPVIGLRVKTP
jgi:rod shape-determining protein MreD